MWSLVSVVKCEWIEGTGNSIEPIRQEGTTVVHGYWMNSLEIGGADMERHAGETQTAALETCARPYDEHHPPVSMHKSANKTRKDFIIQTFSHFTNQKLSTQQVTNYTCRIKNSVQFCTFYFPPLSIFIVSLYVLSISRPFSPLEAGMHAVHILP